MAYNCLSSSARLSNMPPSPPPHQKGRSVARIARAYAQAKANYAHNAVVPPTGGVLQHERTRNSRLLFGARAYLLDNRHTTRRGCHRDRCGGRLAHKYLRCSVRGGCRGGQNNTRTQTDAPTGISISIRMAIYGLSLCRRWRRRYLAYLFTDLQIKLHSTKT